MVAEYKTSIIQNSKTTYIYIGAQDLIITIHIEY